MGIHPSCINHLALSKPRIREVRLGLYIVKLIAEFHGGTARAANREDAGGAVFTVTLPMI